MMTAAEVRVWKHLTIFHAKTQTIESSFLSFLPFYPSRDMTSKVSVSQPKLGTDTDLITHLNQLTRYFLISQITADEIKIAVLLLSVGNKNAALYDQINWPDLETGQTLYGRACDFLKSKLLPKTNILSQRLSFHNEKQNQKTIAEFVSALRDSSKNCAYPKEFFDQALRDQFVLARVCYG